MGNPSPPSEQMSRWFHLPLQVRQCILLFGDGYAAMSLANTCRYLYRSTSTDSWLWAALLETTFPPTEEEQHWREWCLKAPVHRSDIGSLFSSNSLSTKDDSPRRASWVADGETGIRSSIDWYRVFLRRLWVERAWRRGDYMVRRFQLPLDRSHKQIQMVTTSPWRTIMVLGPAWEVIVVEHGARACPPYTLSWTAGYWPGPRKILQSSDFIVAVNSFDGTQHSTWIWRAGYTQPITEQWPLLKDPHRCPVELQGQWLLVSSVKTNELFVLDLETEGTYVKADMPEGYDTCHLQTTDINHGVRVYSSRQKQDQLHWQILNWNQSGVVNQLQKGACQMHTDWFNGRVSSRRLGDSRVLIEARPVWTNDSLYAVHSLNDTDVRHQGSAGIGRAFPFSHQHLRLLPSDQPVQVRLRITDDGEIRLMDPISTGSPPLSSKPVASKDMGQNMQLRRIFGTICYACPLSTDTNAKWRWDEPTRERHYLIDALSGRVLTSFNLSMPSEPTVTVCATHLCLLNAKTRSMTMLDFAVVGGGQAIGKRITTISNDKKELERSLSMDNESVGLAGIAGSWSRPASNSFSRALTKAKQCSFGVWESTVRLASIVLDVERD